MSRPSCQPLFGNVLPPHSVKSAHILATVWLDMERIESLESNLTWPLTSMGDESRGHIPPSCHATCPILSSLLHTAFVINSHNCGCEWEANAPSRVLASFETRRGAINRRSSNGEWWLRDWIFPAIEQEVLGEVVTLRGQMVTAMGHRNSYLPSSILFICILRSEGWSVIWDSILLFNHWILSSSFDVILDGKVDCRALRGRARCVECRQSKHMQPLRRWTSLSCSGGGSSSELEGACRTGGWHIG